LLRRSTGLSPNPGIHYLRKESGRPIHPLHELMNPLQKKSDRISLAEVARQTGAMLRRGDMSHFDQGQAPTLADLTESLFFSPGDGRIWLNDQRMVLLHSSALGNLRRELVDTLGLDRARGLLTRAGYVSGARDAQLVRERWPERDAAAVFMAGAKLHSLEGMVKVTPLDFEFDIDKGTYHGEFLWEHSSEDDEHIAAYGLGTEPACWSQIGYATGYVTSLFGQLVVFRELECRSMGASVCRVVGKHAAAWGDVSEDLRYLQAKDFRRLTEAAAPPHSQPFPALSGSTKGSEKHDLVGASSAFNSACHQLARVATTQATVLFTGESGVGKEAFAQRLHHISPRAMQAFVAVNCAAIPETLIESELFGVERGGLYRGQPVAPRPLRAGARRHPVSGRNRHPEPGQPGQAVACPARGRNRARGRHQNLAGGRARGGRYQCGLASRGEGRPFPRRPVLPPQRLPHPPAAVARAARRHPAADEPFSSPRSPAPWARRRWLHPTGGTGHAALSLSGQHSRAAKFDRTGVISVEEGSAIDVAHMFRREQLNNEALLAIGSQGTLTAANKDDNTGSLLDLLAKAMPGGAVPAGADRIVSLTELEQRLLKEAVDTENGNLAAAARRLGLTRAQLAYRLGKAGSPVEK
jgi:hypothetical protein